MASPGFGFSAGDFIAGISLVKKLIRALNDTVGSRASYRRLIDELLTLGETLDQIKYLHANAAQPTQIAALSRITDKCQLSIETFLNKNAKFKESLGLQPTAPTWRTNLHKIHWALCKDEAIDVLREELSGHTTTLKLALITIQLSATQFTGQAVDTCRQLIESIKGDARKNIEMTRLNQQLLATLTDLVVRASSTLAGSSATHSSELQSLSRMVLESNSKTFTAVMQHQQLCPSIPCQIERQQPVLFEDAHGRQLPFQIEFVNSFAAFQRLLELRFEDVPGSRKVKSLEYAIQDIASKRTIDVSRPWESIFRPGRRLLMSMVFQQPKSSIASCPGCLSETPSHPNDGSIDTLWYGPSAPGTQPTDTSIGLEVQSYLTSVYSPNSNCGIWYRRVTELDTAELGKRRLAGTQEAPAKRKKTGQDSYESREESVGGEIEEDAEDEVHDFRRVQIVHKEVPASSPRAPPCKLPPARDILLETLEQRKASFSAQPAMSRCMGEETPIAYHEYLPSAIHVSRKPNIPRLNDREKRFRSIFAKRPPSHAPSKRSFREVQKGLALSANMSIDTDHNGEQSAGHPGIFGDDQHPDKWNIFARMKDFERLPQETHVPKHDYTQPSLSTSGSFTALYGDRGQEVYSKSFHGWVSVGLGDSLLDPILNAGVGDNEGYYSM